MNELTEETWFCCLITLITQCNDFNEKLNDVDEFNKNNYVLQCIGLHINS